MQYLLKLLKICNIIMNMQYTYNPLSILITNYCFFLQKASFLEHPAWTPAARNSTTCTAMLEQRNANVRVNIPSKSIHTRGAVNVSYQPPTT